MIKTATFSHDRMFRYTLWRRWDKGPACVFIGLNPSTANEEEDDPTIRRCMGFARAWGYGALCMVNLFAFRATRPAMMTKEVFPVGPDNDYHLIEQCCMAGIVIAAWGAHGTHLERDVQVEKLMREHGIALHYLKLTKDGHPSHPLYLPASLKPLLLDNALRAQDLAR